MTDDALYSWPAPRRSSRPAAQVQAEAVYEARLRGESYRKIAEDLDISASAAMKMFRDQLERLTEDESSNIELIRRTELERLDAMLDKAWAIIEKGGTNALFAIDRVVRLMERRAKYLGLDAPVKVNIEQRLRKVAEEHGLDVDEVLGEVRAILADQA